MYISDNDVSVNVVGETDIFTDVSVPVNKYFSCIWR